MRAHVSFLMAFALFASWSMGQQDPVACLPPTETCGPFIPLMPRSYVVKLESTDVLKNTTRYTTEYLDADRLRGAIVSDERGQRTTILYDVKANSLTTIRTNGKTGGDAECVVRSLIYDRNNFILGWRDADKDESRYLHLGGALFHYLPQLRFEFVNFTSFTVRGMKAKTWRGCVYVPPVFGTFKLEYYWSEGTTPSGEDSVPLKSEVEGHYLPDPKNPHLEVDVQVVNQVVWFRPEPDLDDSFFQPPRGVFCKNFNQKPFPTLPPAFSVSAESRSVDGTVENYKIWYNLPLKVSRVDNLFSPSNVVTVHDYSTGIVYKMDENRSRCSCSLLTRQESFPEFFSVNVDRLEYSGKYVVRDRTCRVWTGLSTDDRSLTEWSFLDDSWHQIEDDGSAVNLLPVQLITANRSEPFFQGRVVNYFHFVPNDQHFIYDVASCFPRNERKYFQVAFPGDARLNSRKFVAAFRLVVSKAIGVSPLRIADVQVERDADAKRVFVQFIILPRLKGQPDSASDVSLERALTNLKTNVENNGIIVANQLDSNEAQYLTALPDSLVELDAVDPCSTISDDSHARSRRSSLSYSSSDDNTHDSTDRYSSGDLIGLGFGLFIVGLVLGSEATLIVLIKLQKRTLISDDIQLTRSVPEET